MSEFKLRAGMRIGHRLTNEVGILIVETNPFYPDKPKYVVRWDGGGETVVIGFFFTEPSAQFFVLDPIDQLIEVVE